MATDTGIEVVMPQMGVSVSEGTITKWLKQQGEEIQADEPLLEISTDKVDTEVPSPGTGTLQQILVQEGETVDVGTKLAVIGGQRGAPAQEEAPPEPATQQAADESAAAAEAETDMPTRREPQPPRRHPRRPHRRTTAPGDENGDGPSFVSPVVARIASEHGVDPNQVSGHRPRRPRDQEGHPRASSSRAPRRSRSSPSRRLRRAPAAAPAPAEAPAAPRGPAGSRPGADAGAASPSRPARASSSSR